MDNVSTRLPRPRAQLPRNNSHTARPRTALMTRAREWKSSRAKPFTNETETAKSATRELKCSFACLCLHNNQRTYVGAHHHGRGLQTVFHDEVNCQRIPCLTGSFLCTLPMAVLPMKSRNAGSSSKDATWLTTHSAYRRKPSSLLFSNPSMSNA